jgi:PadR family transcriptional regulator PadR
VDELKWLTQVKRGLLELCILNLVGQDEMYGYQIVKRLSTVPGLVIPIGTIYPLLSRLKREGMLASSLVESDQGPARRTYSLTSEGRRHMRMINDAWAEIVGSVQHVISTTTPRDTGA